MSPTTIKSLKSAIFSALLVLAPHSLHLPLWVTLLCGATLAWRAAITLQGNVLIA